MSRNISICKGVPGLTLSSPVTKVPPCFTPTPRIGTGAETDISPRTSMILKRQTIIYLILISFIYCGVVNLIISNTPWFRLSALLKFFFLVPFFFFLILFYIQHVLHKCIVPLFSFSFLLFLPISFFLPFVVRLLENIMFINETSYFNSKKKKKRKMFFSCKIDCYLSILVKYFKCRRISFGELPFIA